MFDEITNNLLHDNVDFDVCIERLSDLIYDISFQINGKTFSVNPTSKPNNRKSLWFDATCKEHKHIFYHCKRLFKDKPTDVNRLSFLNARSNFCDVKRKAKRIFYTKERHMLTTLSKACTHTFE